DCDCQDLLPRRRSFAPAFPSPPYNENGQRFLNLYPPAQLHGPRTRSDSACLSHVGGGAVRVVPVLCGAAARRPAGGAGSATAGRWRLTLPLSDGMIEGEGADLAGRSGPVRSASLHGVASVRWGLVHSGPEVTTDGDGDAALWNVSEP